jgi:glycosyltransferase involved in cell wall biosynthesis
VPVFSLGMRRGTPDPRGLARLAAALKHLRPQVLHSHMFHANLMARVVRLLCPVPALVNTLHSAAESSSGADGRFLGSAGRQGTVWRDRLYRLTGPLADAVVAVSRAAADRHVSCRAVQLDKVRVIPNGVDTSAFRPDPERRVRVRRELGLKSGFVWLAAGRLMWKKDYPTLLRAFALSTGAATGETTLLIAGAGPQEGELRKLAAELGIGTSVRFLGQVSDMPALMNAADAFVLSSVVEGLPVALLEAAASGLAAIATDAGGVREIVGGDEVGFVVSPSDPAALAAALERLRLLPADARERMSHAARATATKRFDQSVVVAQWEATYRELLESASPWT